MKRLYIVRHSKAVEYAADHTDFSRCLADKGIRKARLISQHLSLQLDKVDEILSSPACRALETARIFAAALQYPPERIRTHDLLYHFGGIGHAMQIIASQHESIDTLMLFGHNPTFTALAWHLCPDFRQDLPTCGLVGLDLDIPSWQKISSGQATLVTYLTHRHLG